MKRLDLIQFLSDHFTDKALCTYTNNESSPSSSLSLTLLLSFSMFPKSTHETFSNKLYQTFKNNKRFIKPKLSRSDFTIDHYAGEVKLNIIGNTSWEKQIYILIFLNPDIFQVLYQSNQFLDKNKDYVVPEHQDLLGASKCYFVAGLFPPLPEETSKSSKFSSISARFKVQFVFSVLSSKLVLITFTGH